MKKLIAMLLAMAMVFALVACGGSNDKPSSNQGAASSGNASASTSTPDASTPSQDDVEKTLTVGLTSDVTPLSSVNPTTETAAWINNIMYPTLVAADVNEAGELEIVYQLLESCTTEDNKTFTLKLKDNIYWSDGKKVTAEDVVFAVDCFTNPDVGSTSMATFLTMLDGIVDGRKGYREAGTELTAASVVDELTLNIVCSSEYDVDFIVNRLCYNLYALPKHVLGDIPATELLASDAVFKSDVVYGAFSLHSFVSASELVLAANENYYQGAPKLDYIRFVFTTAAQITTQLASGEIDMAWPGTIDAADYAYVASLENCVTEVGAPNSLVALFVNNERIPDVNVRKAISLAIDRQAIVDGILGGYGEISNLPVSSTSPYINNTYATPEMNVELAKQLVADSGFNTPISITIGTGKTTTQNIAAMLQASLQAIGLNVEIKTSDNAVLDCIFGDYDLVIITQTEQPLTPSHTLGIAINTGSWCKYETAESVELYGKLMAPTTDEELQAVMNRLQEIVATEYPIVPLYNATSLLAKTKNMTYGGPASYGMLADIHLWDVAE